jgi:hypothetical protein
MKHYKVGKDISITHISDRVSQKIDSTGFPMPFWILAAIAVSYLIGQTIFIFTTR